MARTIRNIVEQLMDDGFDITYYVRKDGGILIRSINGQKFTGATGNQVAREMVGEALSERRETQLASATKKRQSFAEEFGKAAFNKYKKVASKWRRANLPSSAGKISMKKFREIAREKGTAEALRILSEKEKYASGIAYSANIDILLQKLDSLITSLGEEADTSALEDLYNLIDENRDSIREDAINPVYQELYRLNTEMLTEELIQEVANNVKRILNI